MTALARMACRLAFIVVAWLIPATLNFAAEPEVGAFLSLAGQLLVAAPDGTDSRFEGTVVYVVHHDRDGAFGIVINRPGGEQNFADVLDALGENSEGVSGSVQIFAGGPLERELGFVLHTAEYHDAQTVLIDGNFALTSDPAILRAMAAGRGPKLSLVAFGYTGWAPGQLEDELGHNDWYVAPADAALLFDKDRDTVWQRAFDRKTMRL